MPDHSAGQTEHLVNVIGAFVTAVGDDLTAALEDEVHAGGAGPAALLALDTWPDRSVGFLSRVLGLTHSGTVRLVDRLEGQRLVRRRSGPDDRTVAIRLTGSGRRTAAREREERSRLLSDLVEPLSAVERRLLGALLDRILRSRPRIRLEAQRACRLCDHTVCRGEDCPIGASVDGE